jgi:hypothetical protein
MLVRPRKQFNLISEEEKTKVVEGYINGFSACELTRRFMLSEPCVRRIMKERGVRPRERSESVKLRISHDMGQKDIFGDRRDQSSLAKTYPR